MDLETITDPLTGVAHFKRINDTLGHAAGDAVLRQFGARLRASIRTHDVLARLGGEEFAVYLSAATRDETGRVADRLRSIIAETPFRFGEREFPVTISVSVRWQSEPVADWDAILQIADRALYAAKSLGRNRVVFDDLPQVRAA